MTRIDSFQSQQMKREGRAPQFSLFRRLVVCSGPTRTITGEIVDATPATAMWEHVKGARWFGSLSECVSANPGVDVSPWAYVDETQRVVDANTEPLDVDRSGSVMHRILQGR